VTSKLNELQFATVYAPRARRAAETRKCQLDLFARPKNAGPHHRRSPRTRPRKWINLNHLSNLIKSCSHCDLGNARKIALRITAFANNQDNRGKYVVKHRNIQPPPHQPHRTAPATQSRRMSLCKATLRAASKSATARPLTSTRALSTVGPIANLSPSPLAPRHFLSIADLTPKELSTLVRQASRAKHAIKSGNIPSSLQGTLAGKTVALMFSKRSTRTRVSTEAAVVYMGGHPMFLGRDDIQLGVRPP